MSLFRIGEGVMSSIQGVSSANSGLAVHAQKPVVQPAPKAQDSDGDVDKKGAVDRDKGNKIDVQG